MSLLFRPQRWMYLVVRAYLWIFRPVALGSRALVIQNRKVLLVKMSYVSGWYLPGGGVKKGESFRDGLVRELLEECAIEPTEMELFGLYFTGGQRNDHVAIYLVTAFKEISDRKPDAEILEIKFFSLDQLPSDISPATQRRIQEYKNQIKGVEKW